MLFICLVTFVSVALDLTVLLPLAIGLTLYRSIKTKDYSEHVLTAAFRPILCAQFFILSLDDVMIEKWRAFKYLFVLYRYSHFNLWSVLFDSQVPCAVLLLVVNY